MRNFTPASVLAVAVWRIARITGSIFAASEDIRGGGGTLAEDCRSQADAWPETGVQSEGRIDDHGSDFILFHFSKPALLSTRAKNLCVFLGFEFGHAGLGGTRRSREMNFTQGPRGTRTGEAKYGSGNFAPWPLSVSL